MFQLLAYRELIKQDWERIGKGHFQGNVVSREMIATWLLSYQSQSVEVPGCMSYGYLKIKILAHHRYLCIPAFLLPPG